MDQPTPPKILKICGFLALALLAALPLAPLATRFGLLGWQSGLPLTALAVVGSGLLLCVLVFLFFRPALRAVRPLTAAIAGVALAPVMAGALVVLPAGDKPVIHDISTDITDPPQFVAAPARRGPGANPLERGPEVDALQSSGYPTLTGIESPLAPEAAFARALKVAKSLGWEVYAQDAAAGTLEASQTTFWFGFVDDVAIRIRPAPNGSRLDLRSASRVGRGDLGANAARIQRFELAFAANPD
jgi:uncharacterized protein (DUF1499 family)